MKNKTHFIHISILAILLSHFSLPAQYFQWAKKCPGQTVCEIVASGTSKVVLSGEFFGEVDFDPGTGEYLLNNPENIPEVYILQLDAAGNFLSAGQLTSPERTLAGDITTDPFGNIYLAGTFEGNTDFDPGPGIYSVTPSHGDIYVLKLDPAGNFLWVKTMPMVAYRTRCSSIELDREGNILLGGYGGANGGDFDPGPGTYIPPGNGEIFACKLTPDGNFLWVKSMTVITVDDEIYLWDIESDSENSVYLTGQFDNSTDFEPGSGVTTLSTAGGSDVFLLKLDSAGDFKWAKKVGGTGDDVAYDMAVDSADNMVIIGDFELTVDFNPGSGVSNLISYYDVDTYILKLQKDGSFFWVRQLKGIDDNGGTQVEVDASGAIISSGNFESETDFDPGAGTYWIIPDHPYDNVYVQKWDEGGDGIWAKGIFIQPTFFEPSHYLRIQGLTVDDNGDIYCTGWFDTRTDFDPSSSIYYLIPEYKNVFIFKLGSTVSNTPATILPDLTIFPNPAHESIEIQSPLGLSKITLLDEMGRVVLEVQGDNQNQIQINLSVMKAGFYLLIAETGSSLVTKKLIIK